MSRSPFLSISSPVIGWRSRLRTAATPSASSRRARLRSQSRLLAELAAAQPDVTGRPARGDRRGAGRHADPHDDADPAGRPRPAARGGAMTRGLHEAVQALKAEKRKPTDADRPPPSTFPGRKIKLLPGSSRSARTSTARWSPPPRHRRGDAGGVSEPLLADDQGVRYEPLTNGPAAPKRSGPGNGGFSSDATPTLFTLAEAAQLLLSAMKDKSYRATPIGQLVGRCIRWCRNERGLAAGRLGAWEGMLATHVPDPRASTTRRSHARRPPYCHRPRGGQGATDAEERQQSRSGSSGSGLWTRASPTCSPATRLRYP